MKLSKKIIKDWRDVVAKNPEQIEQLVYKASKLKVKSLHESTLKKYHEEIFNELSCLDCANCCSKLPPLLNDTDIRRVSRFIKTEYKIFRKNLVKIDEDNCMILSKTPCIFLKSDNYCKIYEARPNACREYPHTIEGDWKKNFKLHSKNAYYCPAVYYILLRVLPEE